MKRREKKKEEEVEDSNNGGVVGIIIIFVLLRVTLQVYTRMRETHEVVVQIVRASPRKVCGRLCLEDGADGNNHLTRNVTRSARSFKQTKSAGKMTFFWAKRAVLVCFMFQWTVLHGLDLRGRRNEPVQASSEVSSETSTEVDENLFKWVKEVGGRAQSTLDLKLMDGKDDTCENFCSCMAGELVQLLLQGPRFES